MSAHYHSQDPWEKFIAWLMKVVHRLDELKYALFKIAVFIVFVHWLIKNVRGEIGW